jgi:hypothetical protein
LRPESGVSMLFTGEDAALPTAVPSNSHSALGISGGAMSTRFMIEVESEVEVDGEVEVVCFVRTPKHAEKLLVSRFCSTAEVKTLTHFSRTVSR